MINKEFVRRRIARVALLAAAVTIIMISAPSAIARAIVYVSNADSREIYVMELRRGKVKLIEKVPVSGSVMPLAVSPDRKFLYAALRSEPYSVASFAIDRESGQLTPIKTTPLADNMAYIATDRVGRYLFGASYTGHKISVNAVNSGGAVDPVALQIIPTGRNAHCILTDPSNRFLFVSNLGDDLLRQYRFDPLSGQLAPNEPAVIETKKGAGPRHFVFHPNGRLVFAANELDGTVNAYRLESSGVLEFIDSISALPSDSREKPWAADLHLTPNGKFLYASERTTSTLAAFRVEAQTGRLTPLGNYPTEAQPRGFNIDPKGKYLIAAGQKSDALSVYEINAKTGNLRLRSRTPVGRNPNWIEIVALP
jgi:6-phosphogluconolactonase